MLSAWGLAMVVSSFLFLYIGYLVDEILRNYTKLYAVFLLSGNRSLRLEALSGGTGQRKKFITNLFSKQTRSILLKALKRKKFFNL